MGKTFSTGLLTDGISQDSSNNIGIGVAPSGTNKFEVSGSTKLNGNALMSGSLTISSSANAIILPAGQTIGLGTAQLYTGTGGNSGNIFIQGAQTKLYADKVVLEAATSAGVEVIGGTKLSGSFIVSGSATTIGTTVLSGSLTVSGSITSTSTITAQTLVVQTITSSIVYSSGSNIFGNSLANTQQFTGSVSITGSLTLNNIAIPTSASLASTYLPLTGGTLTGALGGTSATFSGNVAVGQGSTGTVNIGGTTPSINAASFLRLQGSNTAQNYEISVNQYVANSISITPSTSLGGTTYTTPILTMSSTSGLSVTGAATFTTATNTGITIQTPDVVTLKMLGTGGTSTNWGFARSLSAVGDFGIYKSTSVGGDPISAGTAALYFLNTGAATFSGSVNVNGLATSANYKLGVTGAAFISGANNKGVFITDAASYASIVGLNSAIAAYNGLEIRASGTDYQLYLSTNGYVGIGTASPATKLDIRGTSASVNATLQIVGNSVSTLLLGQNSDGGVIRGQGGNDVLSFWTGGAGDTGAGSSGTERMRITSGGAVSIGSTTPSGVFYVKTATDYNLRVVNAGGIGRIDFLNDANGAYQAFSFGNNWMSFSTAGNVTIAGALSKGSGSFRIEHPLLSKKNTHELVHSFIEGPQADLIYRGKIRLINGKITVNIDEAAGMTEGTFEALCREIQCFTSNETGWDAVKGKVEGNILTIESQNTESTDEISWLVIGERQDEHMYETNWTDENGKVIVEPSIPENK
jgi:hypothetical protein